MQRKGLFSNKASEKVSPAVTESLNTMASVLPLFSVHCLCMFIKMEAVTRKKTKKKHRTTFLAGQVSSCTQEHQQANPSRWPRVDPDTPHGWSASDSGITSSSCQTFLFFIVKYNNKLFMLSSDICSNHPTICVTSLNNHPVHALLIPQKQVIFRWFFCSTGHAESTGVDGDVSKLLLTG